MISSNTHGLEKNNLPKIGVLLYTYNRIDDVRINMEIIRNVWQKYELFKDVAVVHSFNGEKEWWPEKYLENELIFTGNTGHFTGAEMLINEGIKTFATKYPNVDYVIILASDTWLVFPEYLEKNIMIMKKENKYITTCAWGTKQDSDVFKTGMSIDFNILDIRWANKNNLFPILYGEFLNKYSEILSYQDELIYLERVFALRFKQAIIKSSVISSENLINEISYKRINQTKEREPVHINYKKWLKKPYLVRRMYWKKLGLITHHEPIPKQKALKEWNLNLGKHGQYFLNAKDLSYYNEGFIKTKQ